MAWLELPEVCHKATASREVIFPVRMGMGTHTPDPTGAIPVTHGHTLAPLQRGDKV